MTIWRWALLAAALWIGVNGLLALGLYLIYRAEEKLREKELPR